MLPFFSSCAQYKPSSHYKGPLEFERVRLKQDLTGVHLVCTGLIPRPQYPFHSGLGMRLLANVLISVSLLGCRVGDGVLYLWTTSGVCVCVGVGVGVDVCVCVWVWVWVCVCVGVCM